MTTNSIVKNLKENRSSVSRILEKNVKQTETETAKAKATFLDLLRNYETAYITDNNSEEYANALQTLATACTYSVLKKLYKVSSQSVIRDLMISVRRDLADILRLQYATELETETIYNSDGDPETVIADRDCHKAVTDLCKTAYGDGLDLVNTAVVALLEETEKARTRDIISVGFLENKYNIKKLKKRVVMTAEPLTADDMQEIETAPIREVYKAIRRDIEKTRAVQIANNKYTYLEQTANISGQDETYYRRLPMYSNLAGEQTDINGRVMFPTVDEQTVLDIDKIIDSLGLSPRQATIVKYRLSGYGYKVIANTLGIQQRLVTRTLKQVQAKLYDLGIYPDGITERPEVK